MKIKINKEIIKSLSPCKDRYENYLRNYSTFEGYLEEFLDLDHITHQDKMWVSVRLMPPFLVECFAIDCATAAAAYAADAAAAAAAYAADAAAAYAAAAYAAAAYAADAADAIEKQRQLEAIIFLVQSHDGN